MAKHVDNKFCWVIKNFSSLQSEKFIHSVPVLIGDTKWRLRAYPNGYNVVDHFSLFLEVADLESLPSSWRRYVKFRLTLASKYPREHPVWEEGHCWFDKVSSCRGWPSMIPLTKLLDKDAGFVVNGELTIFAEVEVAEVTDTLETSEKSKESSRPLKKTKRNDDCGESNESLKDSIVVNGFQVLPSQVETVIRIFERHPDIAVGCRAKSQDLRTTCMSFLLNLIGTLCKPLQELSNDDLVDADISLKYLKEVNFKVAWLEKKLDQVKQNKVKEQSALVKLQETEENILKLKEKLSEQDALAEEQKAELLATRTTLSFDDVV